MQQHQIREVLCEPVQLVLVTHGIHVVVLVSVEVVLDALGLVVERHADVELFAGLVDDPFARKANHFVLRDLQRATEHRDHQHDDGDVVCEHVPPWFQNPIRRLCVNKVSQLSDGNHDSLPEKQREPRDDKL